MKGSIKCALVLFSFMMALTFGVAFADKEMATNATKNVTTNETLENETLNVTNENNTSENVTAANVVAENNTKEVKK